MEESPLISITPTVKHNVIVMIWDCRESLVDDPRPGQANTVITVDLIVKVDDLVRSDQRVTLRMFAVEADVSVGTVWTVVRVRLHYRKMSAQWVPKQLTDQSKELRMGLANICFGIMKIPLSWSGSSQVMRTGAKNRLHSESRERNQISTHALLAMLKHLALCQERQL
ncbi:hypothetical protein HNY73_015489 [Argiope bruennichi]|uniref:Uncharacterized protein n=1 Tax=Argiope bruennichi TaxID=94029 RepID=A0A8T0ESF7_ARGBR|nr:hypothetical protein HNY73_015489 [Argiope bruennichi]